MDMKRSRSQAPVWPYVSIYLVISIGLIIALFQIRNRTLAEFDPQRDTAAWARWRSETATPDPEATTARRPVVADAPPSYLLLRDHFAACLVGLWLTSSVPLAVTLWLLRAVLHSPESQRFAEARRSDSSGRV